MSVVRALEQVSLAVDGGAGRLLRKDAPLRTLLHRALWTHSSSLATLLGSDACDGAVAADTAVALLTLTASLPSDVAPLRPLLAPLLAIALGEVRDGASATRARAAAVVVAARVLQTAAASSSLWEEVRFASQPKADSLTMWSGAVHSSLSS